MKRNIITACLVMVALLFVALAWKGSATQADEPLQWHITESPSRTCYEWFGRYGEPVAVFPMKFCPDKTYKDMYK